MGLIYLFVMDSYTFEDGTDGLPRNVGKELPSQIAQ